MVIGRNETCHCGSGIKYKKCCLKTDTDNQNKVTKSVNITTDLPQSTHDYTMGIKELVLHLMGKINILLSMDRIQAPIIMIESFELKRIATESNIFDLYVTMVKDLLIKEKKPFNNEDLEKIKDRAYTLPGLTENEKRILATVEEFNTGELQKVFFEQPINYRALEIHNEFCYNVIKDGVSDARNISAVTYYLKKDRENRWELADWEFTYSIEKKKALRVNWETYDKVNDKLHRFFNSIRSLEEESIRDIEKTLYPHRKDPGKDYDKLSVKEKIMNLSGVFERELPTIIGVNEGEKTPDLTWQDMITYIKENPLPFLEDVPDFVEIVEQIGEIRDLAANDNEVSNEDYLKIKEFAFDRRALRNISLSKLSYRCYFGE